jgi:tRNA(His) 5'-end guanylyltransferase
MCAKYGFEKPNDRRALDLMNAAAKAVVTDLPEITIAYGVSDEYRCILTMFVPSPIPAADDILKLCFSQVMHPI